MLTDWKEPTRESTSTYLDKRAGEKHKLPDSTKNVNMMRTLWSS